MNATYTRLIHHTKPASLLRVLVVDVCSEWKKEKKGLARTYTYTARRCAIVRRVGPDDVTR
jgi:hypothetical protein